MKKNNLKQEKTAFSHKITIVFQRNIVEAINCRLLMTKKQTSLKISHRTQIREKMTRAL